MGSKVTRVSDDSDIQPNTFFKSSESTQIYENYIYSNLENLGTSRLYYTQKALCQLLNLTYLSPPFLKLNINVKLNCVNNKPFLVYIKTFRYALSSQSDEFKQTENFIKSIDSCISWDLCPNILRTIQFVSDSKSIVRPYLDSTIANRLTQKPALLKSECNWIVFQMLCSIAQLHSIGVYHGNIKTTNFLLTGIHHVFLTDIASWIKPFLFRFEAALKVFTMFYNNPEPDYLEKETYISPERIAYWNLLSPVLDSNQVTKIGLACYASDIFALGCCFIEIYLQGLSLVSITDTIRCARKLRRGFTHKRITQYLPFIQDTAIRDLISRMCMINPEDRPTAVQCIELGVKLNIFPPSFFLFLFPLYTTVCHPLLQCPNLSLAFVVQNEPSIKFKRFIKGNCYYDRKFSPETLFKTVVKSLEYLPFLFTPSNRQVNQPNENSDKAVKCTNTAGSYEFLIERMTSWKKYRKRQLIKNDLPPFDIIPKLDLTESKFYMKALLHMWEKLFSFQCLNIPDRITFWAPEKQTCCVFMTPDVSYLQSIPTPAKLLFIGRPKFLKIPAACSAFSNIVKNTEYDRLGIEESHSYINIQNSGEYDSNVIDSPKVIEQSDLIDSQQNEDKNDDSYPLRAASKQESNADNDSAQSFLDLSSENLDDLTSSDFSEEDEILIRSLQEKVDLDQSNKYKYIDLFLPFARQENSPPENKCKETLSTEGILPSMTDAHLASKKQPTVPENEKVLNKHESKDTEELRKIQGEFNEAFGTFNDLNFDLKKISSHASIENASLDQGDENQNEDSVHISECIPIKETVDLKSEYSTIIIDPEPLIINDLLLDKRDSITCQQMNSISELSSNDLSSDLMSKTTENNKANFLINSKESNELNATAGENDNFNTNSSNKYVSNIDELFDNMTYISGYKQVILNSDDISLIIYVMILLIKQKKATITEVRVESLKTIERFLYKLPENCITMRILPYMNYIFDADKLDPVTLAALNVACSATKYITHYQWRQKYIESVLLSIFLRYLFDKSADLEVLENKLPLIVELYAQSKPKSVNPLFIKVIMQAVANKNMKIQKAILNSCPYIPSLLNLPQLLNEFLPYLITYMNASDSNVRSLFCIKSVAMIESCTNENLKNKLLKFLIPCYSGLLLDSTEDVIEFDLKSLLKLFKFLCKDTNKESFVQQSIQREKLFDVINQLAERIACLTVHPNEKIHTYAKSFYIQLYHMLYQKNIVLFTAYIGPIFKSIGFNFNDIYYLIHSKNPPTITRTEMYQLALKQIPLKTFSLKLLNIYIMQACKHQSLTIAQDFLLSKSDIKSTLSSETKVQNKISIESMILQITSDEGTVTDYDSAWQPIRNNQISCLQDLDDKFSYSRLYDQSEIQLTHQDNGNAEGDCRGLVHSTLMHHKSDNENPNISLVLSAENSKMISGSLQKDSPYQYFNVWNLKALYSDIKLACTSIIKLKTDNKPMNWSLYGLTDIAIGNHDGSIEIFYLTSLKDKPATKLEVDATNSKCTTSTSSLAVTQLRARSSCNSICTIHTNGHFNFWDIRVSTKPVLSHQMSINCGIPSILEIDSLYNAYIGTYSGYLFGLDLRNLLLRSKNHTLQYTLSKYCSYDNNAAGICSSVYHNNVLYLGLLAADNSMIAYNLNKSCVHFSFSSIYIPDNDKLVIPQKNQYIDSYISSVLDLNEESYKVQTEEQTENVPIFSKYKVISIERVSSKKYSSIINPKHHSHKITSLYTNNDKSVFVGSSDHHIRYLSKKLDSCYILNGSKISTYQNTNFHPDKNISILERLDNSNTNEDIIYGHSDIITSLLGVPSYMTDAPNQMLVSGSRDGTIKVWI